MPMFNNLNEKEAIQDHYKMGRVEHSNGYCEVRKCLCKKTKQTREVKILKYSKMNAEEKQRILSEIDLLLSMDHPHILKTYEVFKDRKRIYIVT